MRPSDCGSLKTVFALARRVAPAVVLVLLTWTAVDVLNPALCGLDQMPFVAAHESVDGETSSDDQLPVRTEDCFCCSHNVNFSAMVQVRVAFDSLTQTPAERIQIPLWKSFPLYHPPRLS